MRKKRFQLCLLAALLPLMVLTGCGEKMVTENRTKEAYEIEQVFQPFFLFLETEKKDLSILKRYRSSVQITPKNSNQGIEYSLNFGNHTGDGWTFDRTLPSGENEEYEVPIDNQDFTLPEGIDYPLPTAAFFLTLPQEAFTSLEVADVYSSNFETYRRMIVYKTEGSKQLKQLFEKEFQLENLEITSLMLNASSENEFYMHITISGDNNDYQVYLGLFTL